MHLEQIIARADIISSKLDRLAVKLDLITVEIAQIAVIVGQINLMFNEGKSDTTAKLTVGLRYPLQPTKRRFRRNAGGILVGIMSVYSNCNNFPF